MSLLPSAARRSTVRGASLALASVLVTSVGALAQGPAISIEPAGELPAGAATLTVTGSGFDTAGMGVYVVFGPITPAPGYYLDPSLYSAFKWVHVGATDSAVEAALTADGSFVTTLEVTPTFTSSAGDVDCSATDCAVITFAAHGSQDRSQDTCAWVSFAAPTASALVASSPVPSGPDPSVTPPGEAPSASIAPVATDPCSPITAAAP